MRSHSTGPLVDLLRGLSGIGYRFTTPTPATIARVNARPTNREASDLAGILGWSRPFRPGILPPSIGARLDEAGLVVPEGDRSRATVRVSSLGDDLFLHSAYPTVAADAVFFGPDTYRFVAALQAAMASLPPVRRAVDIGCGAGPGGIAIAKAHPAADVALVDINRQALLYAAANAQAAGCRNVTVVESDLLDGLPGTFDLIVSNPPYLNDPLGRAYRHGGGAYGEALSVRIVRTALDRLAPGGTLVLYTGVAMIGSTDPFRDAMSRDLAEPGLRSRYCEIDPDVFGEELETAAYEAVDRIAVVFLTVTKMSGPRAEPDRGEPDH